MAATRGKKKASNAKDEITDEDREPGVVYIGHVPHGFYEKQLLQYFSQFGKVLNVKLSRSKKNGKSKGYAFIKFKYAAVAKTVADTCHNYLFFNKLLKCEYKPLTEVHEDTFFNFKWKPNTKRKRQHNSAKTASKLEESMQSSLGKQKKKVKKLQELGIDLKLEDIMNVPEVKTVKETPRKVQPSAGEMEVASSDTRVASHKKSLKGSKKPAPSSSVKPQKNTGTPTANSQTDTKSPKDKVTGSRAMKRKRPAGRPAASVKSSTGTRKKVITAKKSKK